jgi:hypothetical protein
VSYLSFDEHENTEYGGVFFEYRGRLHLKITKGTATGVEIPNPSKKNGKVRAEFHTHPNTISLFSDGDMKECFQKSLPQLLGVYQEYYGASGHLLSIYNFLWYDPKRDKSYRINIEEKKKSC